MRIIYDKSTFKILGIIGERVTSNIPASYAGENSSFIDVDYDEDALKNNQLAQLLEREGNNLLGKTLVLKNKNISFQDQRPKQYSKTVIIDIDNPKLNKDVKIYSQKGIKKGAIVDIEDIGSVIFVKIIAQNDVVGTIKLIKKGCCKYEYEEGKVFNREYYPHYVGFYILLQYLKGKAKWLDMGGIALKDEELNRFKRKWGDEKVIEI